ncbi:MAG: winged helix-turn-helix domain-containing protein [Thaumarchaeota archaeon]|nr:winged helix-turn-helix domain-containing protein [Nitrososphaerota archaeon]
MKARELPTYDKLLLPLLEYAKDGRDIALDVAEKYLAEKFKLTEEERRRKKPSGRETIFRDRIFWARLYLKRAGLISYTEKEAHYKITEEGKKFLEEKNPATLNTKILMEFFPSFKQWQDEIKYSKKITRKGKKTASPQEYLGIVILIDTLGTKGILKKRDPNKIREEWREFIKNMNEKAIQEFKKLGNFSFDTFSDTILITVGIKEKEYPLYKISGFLRSFVIESMRIDRPIRGCISVGPIIKDDKIILGDAIDEAVVYHHLPQWVGISASPSAHIEIEKLYHENREKTNLYFQKYDLPLKMSVEQGAWVINWPRLVEKEIEIREILAKRILETKSDIGNALKWRNTVNFFEHVMEEIDDS